MDACHAFALNHGMLLGASPNTPPTSWGEVHSAAPVDVLPKSGHITGGCLSSEGKVHKLGGRMRTKRRKNIHSRKNEQNLLYSLCDPAAIPLPPLAHVGRTRRGVPSEAPTRNISVRRLARHRLARCFRLHRSSCRLRNLQA